VDVSASSGFGTRQRQKREIAAEVCAILAFSAVENNDRVGLVTFSDRIEQLIPPRKGRKHSLRVVRELLFSEPTGRGTDMGIAADTIQGLLKRHAIVFLVSDFLCANLKRALMLMGRKHELIAIQTIDPVELELPPVGIVELQDIETGEKRIFDTWNKSLRESYIDHNRRRMSEINRVFQSLGIDRVVIRTDEAYLDPIVKYFRKRAKRR
jgi:uncharacterized protein (DUF58 family)